ncbi:GTP-binding protein BRASSINAZOLE INSENSITIVE PALE GREEN 2, chloroplastic [Quercus suber]|uniref:GTP-binding protein BRASSINAZOLE INSENSITIVE PALE GREEN 2, chloroplastic n=1 Tax=Quercus suber TaxID=58331 RepID=UPI000CE1DB0B|nr:GTP-binding protein BRASSINAZOLE INSENSITIVE PALE GREEN 2, chloroplastic-like [Quercus suber]
MNMISNGAIVNVFINKKKFAVADPNRDINVNFPFLQPPIGEKRVEELGKWVRKEFVSVTLIAGDSSSVDVAAAGLGWLAIGLKAEALLGVWTYEGVDVVLRNSLIPYRSHTYEVAGFAVSKIVPKVDQALNKRRQNEKKRKQSDPKVSVPAESIILTVVADSNSC